MDEINNTLNDCNIPQELQFKIVNLAKCRNSHCELIYNIIIMYQSYLRLNKKKNKMSFIEYLDYDWNYDRWEYHRKPKNKGQCSFFNCVEEELYFNYMLKNMDN